MKNLLVIPTYNCQNQIGRLIEKSATTINSHFEELLIIDNGSTDETLKIATKSLELIHISVRVLQNCQNISLGGSLKTGFLYATEKNFDYVAILHGDDQAQINDLLPILTQLSEKDIDLAIGARFHPNSKLVGYSKFRKIGNRLLNLYCIICTRTKIDDLIAGLNVFRVSKLDMSEILKFPNNLTFDVHLLLRAINLEHKIQFFPITWTEEDQVSNAKVIRQAMTILGLLTSYFFNRDKALYFKESKYSYRNYNTISEKSTKVD